MQTPKPRLIYTCSLECAAGKGKRMSINCEEKWRFLIPLWRNTEAYLALRNVGKAYEGVHRYWRDRYCVGGVDFYTRPKRIGKEWQQLRASAALLAEWVKICFRQGWLGSERRNFNAPRVKTAAAALKDFLGYRIFLGLDKTAEGQVPPKRDESLADDGPPDDASPPADAGPPDFVAGFEIEF